ITWAPRGISRTYSASVGRRARYRMPSDDRTQLPSGWPMMASWGIQPRSEWKVSPFLRVRRWRFPRWSMRRTCSPSWKDSRTLIGRSDASYSTWRPAEESRRSRAAGLGEKQRHDEPGQRHQRRNPQRTHQPHVVRHPAENRGPDAARTDGEAHDEPRRHAGVARHVGLPQHDRHREGGHQDEPQRPEEDEAQDPPDQEEADGEGRREEEDADDVAAHAHAVGDGTGDEGAQGPGAQENEEQRPDHPRVAPEHVHIV